MKTYTIKPLPADRVPQWLKCMKCSHIWIAIYIPMELGLWTRRMKHVFCPNCGVGAIKLTLAKQDHGVLMESN